MILKVTINSEKKTLTTIVLSILKRIHEFNYHTRMDVSE